jgi:hypothetical protein
MLASMRRGIKEAMKYVVYRSPVVGRIMAPGYPYKVDPGELAAMVGLIESSREHGGAVVEIGVAQGDTSVFLLQHLTSVGDKRPLLLFDTFSGFTDESVAVEVERRGKQRADYDKFRYGDEDIFRRRLSAAGFSNFETFKGDASAFDWASIGPIGAVLLDIDLYEPTKAILDAVYPRLCTGGGIVVDDCVGGGPWDGSLQAYEEFIAAHDLPFERVGHKGAVVRRPQD